MNKHGHYTSSHTCLCGSRMVAFKQPDLKGGHSVFLTCEYPACDADGVTLSWESHLIERAKSQPYAGYVEARQRREQMLRERGLS